MEIPQRLSRRPRPMLIGIAVAALFCGVVYYLMFRWQGGVLANYWPWLSVVRGHVTDPTAGSLPVFFHMITLGCASTALLGMRRGVNMTLALFTLTIIAEFAVGTFDWADLYLAMLGGLCSLVISALVYRSVSGKTGHPVRKITAGSSLTGVAASDIEFSRKVVARYAAGLVASSVLFIAATGPCFFCVDDLYSPNAKPVYLSYTELRNAVAVEASRELEDIGRIYLYEDYIFLNKKNQGIHILDNTDPANPKNVLFINVPGNTELTIRDNYLYADSYVDLVTLNLNDPDNIYEESRQIDIFPWDEYQNVPDDVYFSYNDIDSDRGVVISYVSN